MAEPASVVRTTEPATPRGRRVVVVGDVINDVLVRPLTAITPDSDTRAEIVRRPGGSAANLACWLGTTGRPVTFVGRVGAADHAVHADHLASFGVDATLARDEVRETGTIVVVVDASGGRTMLVDRGANLNLTADDVPSDVLSSAAALHLSGYSFFEPAVRSTALELLQRARRQGVPVSVDPSSVAFLADVGPRQFLTWTAGAGLCFPNLDEATALSGTSDPVGAARLLGAHYETVAITLEGEGSVVVHRGNEPVVVPAERVVPVDTTGAGDAYCAGFLDSWLRDHDAVRAATAGGRLAREAVVRLGARPASPGSRAARAPGATTPPARPGSAPRALPR